VIAALYVLAVSIISLVLGILAALATRPVPEARPALLMLALAGCLAAVAWDIEKEGRRACHERAPRLC
jgi:flagellar biosynthesis component FlhA